MLEKVYSWNVSDHLREGKTVYSVFIGGTRPVVECVNNFTVGEWFEMRENGMDRREFYVVAEPELEDKPKEDNEDVG